MNFTLTQDFPAGLDRLWAVFGRPEYPQQKYCALGATAFRLQQVRVTAQTIDVELDISPIGLPVRARGVGTIVESASGTARMILTWRVTSRVPMMGAKIERLFADQVRAALDDDHAFTLQYLRQVTPA